jgi:hypothetical protein
MDVLVDENAGCQISSKEFDRIWLKFGNERWKVKRFGRFIRMRQEKHHQSNGTISSYSDSSLNFSLEDVIEMNVGNDECAPCKYDWI